MASPIQDVSAEDRTILLNLARESLSQGIAGKGPLRPDPARFSSTLQNERAAFVTLTIDGGLRGCIGTLTARRALVVEVAAMAYAAAFEDPRFPRLSAAELPSVCASISVLSPPVPLNFNSERELLDMLRPGVDGLILSDRGRSGTFLPSVWEKFPRPEDFFKQLRLKAGLPRGHWSPTLRVERYGTESFAEA